MNGRNVCYLQSKGSAAVEQVAPDNAAFALQGASIAERSSPDRTSVGDALKISGEHIPTSRSREHLTTSAPAKLSRLSPGVP